MYISKYGERSSDRIGSPGERFYRNANLSIDQPCQYISEDISDLVIHWKFWFSTYPPQQFEAQHSILCSRTLEFYFYFPHEGDTPRAPRGVAQFGGLSMSPNTPTRSNPASPSICPTSFSPSSHSRRPPVMERSRGNRSKYDVDFSHPLSSSIITTK